MFMIIDPPVPATPTSVVEEGTAASASSASVHRRRSTPVPTRDTIPRPSTFLALPSLGAPRLHAKYARHSAHGAAEESGTAKTDRPSSSSRKIDVDDDDDASDSATGKKTDLTTSVPVASVDVVGDTFQIEEEEDSDKDNDEEEVQLDDGAPISAPFERAQNGDTQENVGGTSEGALEVQSRGCGGGGGGVASGRDNGGRSSDGEWETYDPAAYEDDAVVGATPMAAEDLTLPFPTTLSGETRVAVKNIGTAEGGERRGGDAADMKRTAVRAKSASTEVGRVRATYKFKGSIPRPEARSDSSSRKPGVDDILSAKLKSRSTVRMRTFASDTKQRRTAVAGDAGRVTKNPVKSEGEGGDVESDGNVEVAEVATESETDEDDEGVIDYDGETKLDTAIDKTKVATAGKMYERVVDGPKCAVIILRATSSASTLCSGAYHSTMFSHCSTCDTLVCSACSRSHDLGPGGTNKGTRVCSLVRYVC